MSASAKRAHAAMGTEPALAFGESGSRDSYTNENRRIRSWRSMMLNQRTDEQERLVRAAGRFIAAEMRRELAARGLIRLHFAHRADDGKRLIVGTDEDNGWKIYGTSVITVCTDFPFPTFEAQFRIYIREFADGTQKLVMEDVPGTHGDISEYATAIHMANHWNRFGEMTVEQLKELIEKSKYVPTLTPEEQRALSLA